MLIPPPWAPETASLNKDKTADSLHENSSKVYVLMTIVSTSKPLVNSLMMVSPRVESLLSDRLSYVEIFRTITSATSTQLLQAKAQLARRRPEIYKVCDFRSI